MQTGYLLDTLDIGATYGVYVISSKGALDFLKRKGPTAQKWSDEDGEESFTDSTDIFFEPRDIVLKCYIKATSKATFLTHLTAFKTVLQSAGLHTLKIPYLASAINVYSKAGGPLKMLTKWNGSKVVGTFTLKLREPDPTP